MVTLLMTLNGPQLPLFLYFALIIGSSATTLTAVILVESTSAVDVEFPQIPLGGAYSAPQAL